MNNIPVINGQRHAWGSIKVNMYGRSITGLKAISYGTKQKKENNYGAGDAPVDRTRGNIEPSASITLRKYECDAMKTAGNVSSLTELAPFEIVVSWQATGNDPVITEVIQFAEFTEDMVDTKQGDTTIDQKLPLIIGGITRK